MTSDAPYRRIRFWPWLVLGMIAITLLGLRLIAGRVEGPELPVLGQVPAFSLFDQRGETYQLDDLTGHVWIASFIYTTCPGPCPRVVQRMAEVARRLGPEPDLRLVSFSVDPQSDTPEVLAVYGKTHAIDAERWKLLTGPAAEVLSLVQKGFMSAVARSDESDAERLAAEGPIVHSIRLTLVDRSSRLRGFYDSSDPADVERLIGDTRKLLRSVAASETGG